MTDFSSLSHFSETALLAYIAHQLTVSARSTYEPGTENVADAKVLRAYNELLHRVTSSVSSHTENVNGMPLKAVLEMMNDFGTQYNKAEEIKWVLKTAQERVLKLPDLPRENVS